MSLWSLGLGFFHNFYSSHANVAWKRKAAFQPELSLPDQLLRLPNMPALLFALLSTVSQAVKLICTEDINLSLRNKK